MWRQRSIASGVYSAVVARVRGIGQARGAPLAVASIAMGLLLGAPIAGYAENAGSKVLRIGTSGDYAPFSMAYGARAGSAWQPQGLDIAVANAYARDRGLTIEWVQFRWPDLRAALANKRFDVAMSGITQRPERSLVGRYTVPVAITGAALGWLVGSAKPVSGSGLISTHRLA